MGMFIAVVVTALVVGFAGSSICHFAGKQITELFSDGKNVEHVRKLKPNDSNVSYAFDPAGVQMFDSEMIVTDNESEIENSATGPEDEHIRPGLYRQTHSAAVVDPCYSDREGMYNVVDLERENSATGPERGLAAAEQDDTHQVCQLKPYCKRKPGHKGLCHAVGIGRRRLKETRAERVLRRL